MPSQLTHEEAVQRLLAAGYEAREMYPGSISAWWDTECLGCGTRKHRKLNKATGARCQVCFGRSLRVPEEKAIAVMLSGGYRPLEPYPGASAPWRCECLTCGAIRRPHYSAVKNGHGCKKCDARRRASSAAAAVTQEMLGYGYVPAEPYPGTSIDGEKVSWRLTCMTCRSSYPRWIDNIRDGHECGGCSGWYVDPAEAAGVMRSRGLEPLQPYPGTRPWLSRCKLCGKTSSPRYHVVRDKDHTGCFWCAPNAPLDPDEATAVMVAGGFQPLVPYPGARTPWPSVCDVAGHAVSPTVGVVRKGGGCRDCARYGFHHDRPALVYVITHPVTLAHKVGITAQDSARLASWRRRGWELVGTEQFSLGADAWAVERAVLRWLRDDLGLPPAELTGEGWTETIPSAALPERELLAKVRSVAASIRVRDRLPA